jgi:hypothetical protein
MAEHRYGGPWTQVKLERLSNIRGQVWKDSIEFQKLDIASLELDAVATPCTDVPARHVRLVPEARASDVCC